VKSYEGLYDVDVVAYGDVAEDERREFGVPTPEDDPLDINEGVETSEGVDTMEGVYDDMTLDVFRTDGARDEGYVIFEKVAFEEAEG